MEGCLIYYLSQSSRTQLQAYIMMCSHNYCDYPPCTPQRMVIVRLKRKLLKIKELKFSPALIWALRFTEVKQVGSKQKGAEPRTVPSFSSLASVTCLLVLCFHVYPPIRLSSSRAYFCHAMEPAQPQPTVGTQGIFAGSKTQTTWCLEQPLRTSPDCLPH